MSEEARRRSLGRGLSALFQAEQPPASESQVERALKTVPIEKLSPGRLQPRHRFSEDELEALAGSIRENGILQPILVRPLAGDAGYEIVAGERRWRAAQRAQLHEVPVIIRELDDRAALELALVENIQRQDLNPIEEAQGYHRLIEEFGYAAEDLARHIGRSRSHVANMLRLLTLPAAVRTMVEEGALTAGHARALINAPHCEALARRVAAQGLSVRETERLANAAKAPAGGARRPHPAKSADTLALERRLGLLLGMAVKIEEQGESGRLVLSYKTLEQLDDLIARLERPLAVEPVD
ncbi:MAG: chromosome partitioning protein ParB [Rhodospirillales bacterium]|jgi:ParB family chromosome partitioning protein|nr:chromosome partitioning protein ParB [Rhodospirillales bacterium]